ncbi:Sec14p-like protein [Fragilaria crotonensis]|nr:Sec14p-like protein [Fragilaria crotonensis]
MQSITIKRPLLFLINALLLSASAASGWRLRDLRSGKPMTPLIPHGGGNADDVSPINNSYTFPLVREGDGHEEDPDAIPGRFLRMQNGNREKAKEALHSTLAWRAKHEVDTILGRPHPKFDLCKIILPHCFLGRDTTGHVIFCQRPGFADTNIMHRTNVSKDDLLTHYSWVLEYCWNVLEPRADQTMTSVIDLKGVSLTKTREMLAFAQQFVTMMSSHYPQRAFKTLVINSPGWFGAIYRAISPLLPESTRLTVQILSTGKTQQQVLEEYLGPCLPEALLAGEPLSSSDTSSMENDLREFCLSRLRDAGLEMIPPSGLEQVATHSVTPHAPESQTAELTSLEGLKV